MLQEIKENWSSLSLFSEVHKCKPSKRVNASVKTTNLCKCRMKTQGMESFLLCCACAFVCVTVVHTQFSASASKRYRCHVLLARCIFCLLFKSARISNLGLALLEVNYLCVRLVRFFLHLFYSFERGVNV